jgi:hypothetical protein
VFVLVDTEDILIHDNILFIVNALVFVENDKFSEKVAIILSIFQFQLSSYKLLDNNLGIAQSVEL